MSNKKVLYISYDGMTDPLGQSQVIPYLRELTKQGFQFTLLSVEKKARFKESGNEVRQMLTSIGIEWEILFFTTQPPLISKLYDQYQLNAKALKLYKEKKFDIIHCRSYIAAATGIKLKKTFNASFLFDMRGFWVDERVDSDHWNIKKPLYRFLYRRYKKKEKEYFKESAHIISLTEKGKEELIKNYSVAAGKITVIPCCADLAHFDYHTIREADKQELRNLLGLTPTDKIVSYLGSLGGWYMTEEMLDFFVSVKLKIPAAKFFFITKDNPALIITRAQAKGIDEKDIVTRPANRSQVPLYLSISDWGIFFIKDAYSKKASSPTKQGEIMGMGIPLICNDIGDTGYIVEKTNSGTVIPAFNQAGYSATVNDMNRLQEIDKESIREGAKLFFDLQNGVKQYLLAYKKVQ